DVCDSSACVREGPWIALLIGILPHEVDRAPLGVLPDCLVEAARDFIEIAVLGTCCAAGANRRDTVTDHGRPVCIEGCVARHVDATVVGIEQRVFVSELEAGDGRSGVNRRDAAVGADDQIRYNAEEIPAAAVAPEVIRDEAEALEYFKIQVRK